MPLTELDKDKIRFHLGYPATLTMSSMSFGLPMPLEGLFLLDKAMDIVKEGFPIDNIRRIIGEMDCCQDQMSAARRRFAADSLDGLKLRGIQQGQTEADALEREYARWGLMLCDVLRVPFYPYSQRFSAATAVMSGNIPVRH